MNRTFLFVPPEEKGEVQAAGAHWDERLKCWYILDGEDPARFRRWLDERDDAGNFSITSDQASVAAAVVPCSACGKAIEVICIYCESGSASGEPLDRFTVSDILALDEALRSQLASWPGFREIDYGSPDGARFANHCPHCGAEQDDRELHSEPGQVFFDIPRAAPGAIRLTPLVGQIRLSGDEHFAIE